jgi:hypothetical protein
MATLTDIKVRLNKKLRDADNGTFTDDEKIDAVTSAIEEGLVGVVEFDTSKTFVQGTRIYNLGNNIRAVYDIKMDTALTGNFRTISGDAYEYTVPNLRFRSRYSLNIPTGAVMEIAWFRKLTAADDIPDYAVPYVLKMAIYNTTQLLGAGKVNRFLRNDTSMGEILQFGAQQFREAERIKKTLPGRRFVKI